MMIRGLVDEDVEKVREIHERCYSTEFLFPDFSDPKWALKAIVEDDTGIILFGGVKVLAECIAITDKNYSARKRQSALLKLLQASLFTAGRLQFDQLHAFIQDDTWAEHLGKYGFKPCKGEALVLNTGG